MAGLKDCDLGKVLAGQPHALAMAEASMRHIEFLNREIVILEKVVMQELPDREDYKRLMTVPGIGHVLARTILLETGPISRFPEAGNYASYCRAVKSEHTTNDKKKGECNGKSGNKYLAWAYVEAANFAVRHSDELRGGFSASSSEAGSG